MRRPRSSSRPCATRVALAGAGGLRPATTSSAPNTSSGRTAGVVCRTTAASIAQSAVAGADVETATPTNAARTSTCRLPDGVTRSTTFTVERRNEGYVGSVALRQSEFGIPPISIAGGSIKVKDEIRVEFEIVAAR